MTLSNYDPKLLNFLYELTKQKRCMSYREIANEITLGTGKVSPKTVERWFKFLKRPYNHPRSLSKDRFDYFPKFFYEKLGLRYVYAILENPNIRILKEHPFCKYQNYALWLFDQTLRESVLAIAYPIPIEHVSEFKQSWQRMKEQGFIKNYKIYPMYSSFMIYSPWHKVIDKHGIFHPEKNDENEIDKQIQNFEYYLNDLPKIELIPEIKKNPLIIPSLFEYHFKSWSSQKVWNEIKSKLKDKSWNYILKKKKETDGVGIKKVQEATHNIHKFNLFSQMKVVYLPLQLNSLFFFIILKFKNKIEIIKTIKKLAMISIQLSIYPQKGNKIFLILSTSHKGIQRFFSILDDINVERISISQHEKSLPLLTSEKITKFDYAKLFDIHSLKWK